jgi:putative phosphoesterase
MARIGLISDTHGVWNQNIQTVFKGVAHIIHAGDIGAEVVLEKLRKIAPVTAVKGNTDRDALSSYPEFTLVELEGARIFITHIIGKSSGMNVDVGKAIHALSPDIVVYGHTHQHVAEQTGRCIFINPGSAGQSRMIKMPRSVADIDFGDEFITVNFYDLDSKGGNSIFESRLFPFER